MHQSQINMFPRRSAKMIDGTEKLKIPSKFANRAARYNEFGYKRLFTVHLGRSIVQEFLAPS